MARVSFELYGPRPVASHLFWSVSPLLCEVQSSELWEPVFKAVALCAGVLNAYIVLACGCL